MSSMEKERRKFPRLDLNVSVKYKILSDIEKHVFQDFGSFVKDATSRDISVEGICIKTGVQLDLNTVVALDIYFPEISEPIRALGRVMWSKDMEGAGEFSCGVEFVAIKDKYFDQMTQLIAEYYVKKYSISTETDKEGIKDIFLQLFRSSKK
ncbi:MAG: PilZ domain-containing protein [Elusimicrobia bacterium]|nr:PilZ domain-containing protein [Elusimicrobiota bacterium]